MIAKVEFKTVDTSEMDDVTQLDATLNGLVAMGFLFVGTVGALIIMARET